MNNKLPTTADEARVGEPLAASSLFGPNSATGKWMWYNRPVKELVPRLAEALGICAGACAIVHPDDDDNQELRAAQTLALDVLKWCDYDAWEAWEGWPNIQAEPSPPDSERGALRI